MASPLFTVALSDYDRYLIQQQTAKTQEILTIMATLAENLDTIANTTNDFITIAGELQNTINAVLAALANVATPEQLAVFDNANSSLATVRGQLEAMQGQLANAVPTTPPTP